MKSPTEVEDGERICQVELRSRPKSEYLERTEVRPFSARPLSHQPTRAGELPVRGENRVAPAGTEESWEQGELLLLMYIVGGREVGQVTVFRRPLSVWKLDLTRL